MFWSSGEQQARVRLVSHFGEADGDITPDMTTLHGPRIPLFAVFVLVLAHGACIRI